MPHMHDVVPDYELQVDILPVGSAPDVTKRPWVDKPDDVSQLRVVHQPQIDDIPPRAVLIMLQADPRIAIVAGQFETRRKLQTHKALMVVRGRIDKVTQDLLLRPLARSRPD